MAADAYQIEYHAELGREPLKQRLRQFRFAIRQIVRRRELSRYEPALARPDVHRVSSRLRPPSHTYCGYRGPWIEDYFFRAFAGNSLGTLPLTYIPIFWTDYYLHSQIHLYSPNEFAAINAEIERVLHEELDPSRGYFTILEYDHPIWNWHRFPRNVLVFSAGGGGDIPVPLLNGSPPFSCPPKDILVSFMGSLGGASDRGGVRSRMEEACRGLAIFGEGEAWHDVMRRSVFTLCPRGLGRTSFRLYEALSCGSIPIYIWDDVEWLPYKDVINWDDIALRVRVDQVESIPERVRSHTPTDICAKQRRIAELYDEYFTFPGTCRQILRVLSTIQSVADMLAITSRRQFG